jgi:hypothetical protein
VRTESSGQESSMAYTVVVLSTDRTLFPFVIVVIGWQPDTILQKILTYFKSQNFRIWYCFFFLQIYVATYANI